eukprot:2216804-Amphidinium_carterae.1
MACCSDAQLLARLEEPSLATVKERDVCGLSSTHPINLPRLVLIVLHLDDERVNCQGKVTF